MLYAKLSKFGNLSKLGKCGKPQEKCLPVQFPLHSHVTERKVIQIVLWYLDSGCSKHMTWDRSWLMNFVKKFIRIVRFRNDHFGAIMGYGEYVIGDSVISRVYYVEGLGHNFLRHDEVLPNLLVVQSIQEQIMVVASTFKPLELRFTWVKFLRSKDENSEVVIKFLKQIQVDLNKTVRYIRTDNGTKFANKDLTEYYERVGIFYQKSVPRTPQQNGVVERWNRTLMEDARTMLIFSKLDGFLMGDVVFGALCYPTNDSEDLGKLQPTADIGIFVRYAPSRKGAACYGGAQNRVGNANPGRQDNVVDEDVDEQPVQDLALNVDNVFQADDCDDAVCEHHEEHEMHDDVQPNYVVDSHADYTSDSNMIPYDQYVKDNAVPVVQSNVSSVPNDAYMMILNEMHEQPAQYVSGTTQNTVVDKSLTAELATYKEQVELYARRARFELTEREQKIDEQLRIVITDRNIKEENLKKELHSVKMQLASTINHNKSMVEEVTSLKKDFKQKENKYLEEFLDMKALKEKVEDKLYKQDQSLQTVHMLCKPKPYYDEQNKVAIGYKNPLCLTRAKQVQPALYNGHEIIKTNHVPAIVHNTEDTLEIAEMTRKKMNDKMKDPECVNHKVKIAPPDYSKENYLATFTPQKQLTPEQIFWSQDLIKMKAEALKKQTTASRPIKALTVYPPNTPATLVPRMLPTKSQVKINIFTLIQLFSEFEKTCKKRITPTGLTEGERGFEQTKECYLTEVIPFFKTLKEHFEGIQKALTKEIKEMKDIFEELEAEVDQNAVNRKHDEIERKNILIAHDNLIADCLSKDVFYIATNSELTVSRFTEMHDAHTIVQARCLELEAELSNLRDKVQKNDHTELVKRFSNLEVNHLNLQLKYQNLKESFGNNPPPPARVTPDFDSVFVIGKMKASLQGKDNAIKKLKMQISQLKETRSEADRTLDFRALDFQITHLTEKVTVLQEQNELFRAENEKVKQHYKELYDSIKITRAKHIEQITAVLTENENLKAQIQNKMKYVTKDHAKPTVLTPGKYAIDVEPILPRNRNNREVHLDYLKHLKESVETLRERVEEAKVERPLDRSIVSACRYTKHSQELLEYATTKSTCIDTIADMNIHANDAPTEQAPAIAPPTKTDDQILPSSKWVPIGKSNCVLDVQNCQLDEQWFNLHKDILKDALDITPTNDDNPFVAPPSSDTVIEYVNTLGYPNTLRNVSAMFVNALYQPWRAILSMINMCLT
ncbi:retrovirus-related pol polyprotein from transposon TNT 1-94 [Tanacetum coccineum]